MIFGIFTGGTSERSKNIFIAIPQYPTRKHLFFSKPKIQRINPLPDDTILDSSKLKQIADYILKCI